MAPEAPPVQRSPHGYQILAAVALSASYVLASWAIVSSASVGSSLSGFAIILLTPLLLALSLFAFIFVAAYGLFAFVLSISFFIQQKAFNRLQLMTALLMAIIGAAAPVAYCAQTGTWPPGLLPFLLVQT